MALVCYEKIEVLTNRGKCQIELHFGSVTKIRKQDEVDVLVVSAFPDNYFPSKKTVIGALYHDLDINVMELAMDKEEDLRQSFSCWWTRPLPSSKNINFKRIMCFEGAYKIGSTPPTVVGEVFRSLISLCKNTEIKVAMPLLASGNQNFKDTLMLQLIVDAAVHWMQIGFLLRALKIVIFSEDPKKVDSSDPRLTDFRQLKLKWDKVLKKKIPRKIEIKYDVYLSYSSDQKPLADLIKEKLTGTKQDLRIFSKKQKINEEEPWQEEIYKDVVSSWRVVTLLAPGFLNDAVCLEEYNIALCCSSTMKRDYLAPLYLENIDVLPTYIGLIQYVDCRPFDEVKITAACKHLFKQLISKNKEALPTQIANTSCTVGLNASYEVFISYCRENSDIALTLKDKIQGKFPDWRIFIDTSVLKAGIAWQSTLYKSIEGSKVILALLSPSFIESRVCQEEFNLSVLLHQDPYYFTHLVPVVIQNIPHMPLWTTAVKHRSKLKISNKKAVEKLITELASHVEMYDRAGEEGSLNVDSLLENWRSERHKQEMSCCGQVTSLNLDKETSQNSNRFDVFISCHQNDKAYEEILMEELKALSPSIYFSQVEERSSRRSHLDSAQIIIPLISEAYLQADELFEELNIGMCRQRFDGSLVLVPVFLEHVRRSPAFVRILSSYFAFNDHYWGRMAFAKQYRESAIPRHHAACLHYVALLVARILLNPIEFEARYKLLFNLEEIKKSTELLKVFVYKDDTFDPHKVIAVPGRKQRSRSCTFI